MSYQGRSPIKDVVRSVVMSAAMISPALLQACAKSPTSPPEPIPPEPIDLGLAGDGGVLEVATDPSATPAVKAPPDAVVRPRTDPSARPQMPTRGFAGAVRARG